MKMFPPILLVCALLTGCATNNNHDKEDLAIAQANFAVKNYNLSYNHLLPLAQKGNKDAQYALGYLYYYGYGIERDERLAMDWIDKAARQGQYQAIEARRQLQVSSENPFYLPKE